MTIRRKRKKFGWVLLIFAVLVGAVAALLILRPDIRTKGLILWDQTFSNQPLIERYFPSLCKTTLEEVKQGNTGISYNRFLMLVNSAYPMDDSTTPALTEYKDTGLQMDEAVAKAFGELSKTVGDQFQERLLINSSYRTADQQANEYRDNPEEAAKPGESEHETGLALDVCVRQFAGAGFLKSPVGEFVNRHGWEYGFITRYPMFKKGSTGIGFEPWHIRYVGKPHSQIIYQNGWCLEEYLDALVPDKYYECAGYIITRQKADQPIWYPEGLTEMSLSPDHTGYVVLTGKKG